ncbi:MAG: dTDP-4-dehydrorhamnose reductase [Salinivirgaceae bacterium]|nr:dTDP-4-dehydrorhamnose reductase [Salinivirgaceae bacterium]
MNSRKILVTGSNGQLGSELRKIANDYDDFTFHFTDVAELDITNYEALVNFVKDKKINTIINCAAYTAVDKAEDEKELALKINAEATANLAKIMHDTKGQLIHVSTDYVFKGNNFLPYSEIDKIDPINYYGFSKLKGEEEIFKFPINAQIIRTSWLYSSFGNNFVKTILRVAKERDELKVVFDQIGTPTYAADLAQAIMTILAKEKAASSVPSVYHYSNEGVASWFDFAIAIVEGSSSKSKILPVRSSEFPTIANRPNYSVLDKTKIKKEYNLEIPYWKDSLQVCLKKLNNDE